MKGIKQYSPRALARANTENLIGGWREGGFVVSRSSMRVRITSDVRSIAVAAALPWLVAVMPAVATTPQYQIYDIGVIDAGDTTSQGFGVSRAGIAVGRSIRTDGSQAFIWTLDYGIIGLPNLVGRSFAVSNSANDSGIVVGTAATTLFSSDRLPVIWQNGAVSQLRCRQAKRLVTLTR